MPATTELGSKMVAGVPVNILRGPRIIAVAGNLGDLWGEQHRIETRTKPNHSWVNSGRLMIGGNYSRSPRESISLETGSGRVRLAVHSGKPRHHASAACANFGAFVAAAF